MLRIATSRRLRPPERFPWRDFHTSRRLDSEYVWNELVERTAANAYEFHNLFQHFHEFTGYSYLVSIPVVTVLVRSLVTPFRYYLALRRRQQLDIIPQLQSAASIVTKQAEQRTAAGVESKAQTDLWVQKRWEQKLQELRKEHPLVKPTILMVPNSRYDAANVGAALLVIANTSTILSQSLSHPTTLGLVMLDTNIYVLAICSTFLASRNIWYYHADPMRKEDDTEKTPVSSMNPLDWTESEKHLMYTVILPALAGFGLIVSPPAVCISVLSNSIYTFLEQKCIAFIIPSSKQVTSDVLIEPKAGQDLEVASGRVDSPDSKSPR